MLVGVGECGWPLSCKLGIVAGGCVVAHASQVREISKMMCKEGLPGDL